MGEIFERNREGDWTDLADRVAGQAVRERAEQEYAARKASSPVRAWLARALDAKTDERAWRVGADGEEITGRRLDKLRRRGWHVLHSVPVGDRGSDIDHVAIGPGGVWTLNTKRHPGARIWLSERSLLVNGQRTDYLRNSRFEARRAERLLTEACGFPVGVRAAIIVLTGTLAPDLTVRSRPDDVAVLVRRDVPRIFLRATAVFTPAQAEAVFDVARRSTTWTPNPR